jgi:hypothetical protein
MNQDMRNKSCECECRKVKDDNKRTKEAIPLKIEEVLKLWALCHKVLFCENASKSLEKSERTVKTFYGESSLFIGVRGVVQENRLDITVASFPEGVSTPMFRG